MRWELEFRNRNVVAVQRCGEFAIMRLLFGLQVRLRAEAKRNYD